MFEVEEEHSALLFSADAEAPFGTFVATLTDPSGAVLLDAVAMKEEPYSLSGAQYADTASHLNWPILAEHGSLTPGTWEIEVGPLDGEFNLKRGVEVLGSLTLKSDDDHASGTLDATVVYGGGADQDAELVRATEAAVVVWQGLYATYGITVNVNYAVYDGQLADAPRGADGDAYTEIAASLPLGTLAVVVLPDFANWDGIYGLTGGIPGPLVATDRSAVSLSGLVNSGPDLLFNDEEIRIFGETMAHEVGHYMGGFHPVEQNWDNWDLVRDTVECADEAGCVGAFRDNLLFPYPVCGPSVCVPQTELTPGQAVVWQNYTGVR